MRLIFTFGHGQEHFPGYVIVHGVDRAACRRLMNETYDYKWSQEYANETEAGVLRWNLPLIAELGK